MKHLVTLVVVLSPLSLAFTAFSQPPQPIAKEASTHCVCNSNPALSQ